MNALDAIDPWVLLGAKLEVQVSELGTFPRIYLMLELAVEWIDKDEAEGEVNDDSGGTTFSAGPGVRIRFSDRLSAAMTIAIPVAQDLNGFQHEEDYEFLAGVTLDF